MKIYDNDIVHSNGELSLSTAVFFFCNDQRQRSGDDMTTVVSEWWKKVGSYVVTYHQRGITGYDRPPRYTRPVMTKANGSKTETVKNTTSLGGRIWIRLGGVEMLRVPRGEL